MAFKLKHSETAAAGLKRIVIEAINDAVRRIKARRQDTQYLAETVHEVRKDIKKIRSVLRLMRGCLGKAASHFENACYRDLGHQLSDAREMQILCETIAKVAAGSGGAVARMRDDIQRSLTKERDALNQLLRAKDVLRRLTAELTDAKTRAEGWLGMSGGWRSLKKGLKRACAQGRQAFQNAYAHPTFENFHEWRKRVKDLTFDLRLLKPLWPEMLSAQAETADELSELLGDGHDLSVLEQFLSQQAAAHGRDLAPLLKSMARRREELRKRAKPIGKKLYAAEPRVFIRRIEALWDAWKE